MFLPQISSQQLGVLVISAGLALSTMAGGDARQRFGQVGGRKLRTSKLPATGSKREAEFP